MSKRYSTLMFDFDGTLFDTKELNFRAYRQAYYDLGVEITEEMFAKTDGLSVYEFNEAMGVKCDVELLRSYKSNYYKELSLLAEPNYYLLQLAKSGKYKTALVTTARLCNIQPLLEKYDLKFDSIITQESVSRHKPDPEAYELAISKLNVDRAEVLVFEDSRAGFVAARRANLDCVSVGKFEKDCIKDMSGGSDARTMLRLNDAGELIVTKQATGEAAVRLSNQAQFLLTNPEGFVPIDADSFVETYDFVSYDMPYLFANSAYDRLDKLTLLPRIVDKLNELSSTDCSATYDDVATESFNKYILPGVEIYNRVTGKEFALPWHSGSEIPDCVNHYRISDYHGDATLENVLVDRDGEVMFIDPVPDNNVVNGRVHDYSKLLQSLVGYESIRDGKTTNYNPELALFDKLARDGLTAEEYQSLKFHTACLLLRRLKHQVEQDPKLVEPYGKIAERLLNQFTIKQFSLTIINEGGM